MTDTPVTQDDWYMAGLIFGWEAPQCTAEAPAPLNDETLAIYMQGVADGGNARLDFEQQKADADNEPVFSDYPTIGPVPSGSIPLDEVLEEQKAILEKLFHQHDPHTDLPEYETWYPPLDGTVQLPE
jgi:hypothetical protein